MTYSLDDYGRMIADQGRMDPYVYALKAVIKPDSVVLDIGTGTGIHALLACKFGARMVYGIEPHAAVQLARELAELNGYADRVTFMQGFSTQITLPEQADVIVSDLRGVLPLFGDHIASIVDARQRHLAQGGILIPRSDTMWAALVEARGVYKDLVGPWDHPYGLPMEPALQQALNSWSDSGTESIRAANLLTESRRWAILDYQRIEEADAQSGELVLEAKRAGTAHGWLIWFDTELAEGIGFSCGPEEAKIAEVYGRGFFPLLEPVQVEKGDAIHFSVQAELTGLDYAWRWQTRIESHDDPSITKADFKQATDADDRFGSSALMDRIGDQRPQLIEEGQIDLFILGAMDGDKTYVQIARETRERFPRHFKDAASALRYVYEFYRHYIY